MAAREAGGTWRAALVGLAAAAVALGVAGLVAALAAPRAAPVAALGAAVVDATPAWLKDAAIAAFGTRDKLALEVSVLLVLAALAAGAGIVAARSRAAGVAVVGGLGLVAAAAAVGRPGAGPGAAVPTLVGTLAGAATLWLLSPAPAGAGAAPSAPPEGVDRRRALGLAGAVLLVGAAAAVAGQVLAAGRSALEAARAALRIPAPARPAPPLPDGVQVPGVGPFVTPAADFYRIDTALTIPRVDPATWRLRVHGLVERDVTLGLDELLGGALVEAWVTLTCVSNPIGGSLAGNALWTGLPVREVLALAGPLPGADMVLSRSADGFTASTPIEVLLDGRDALLAVAMNGEPLPLAHGFPVRLVVPGLYGYVSATKWLVDLEVTRFADATAYWTTRGWAERAPVKTASRIDVPRSGARVPAGVVAVGGTAWAQHRGVTAVQVRVDGGPWQDADLAAVPGVDTWRQWSLAWDAVPGEHRLEVRAADPDGFQTGEQSAPAPDGATGWHSVRVVVTGA